MDIKGLSLKILLTLNQETKNTSKPSYSRKTWKNQADLFRILRNIKDITEIAITEHYEILRSVISPPPKSNPNGDLHQDRDVRGRGLPYQQWYTIQLSEKRPQAPWILKLLGR